MLLILLALVIALFVLLALVAPSEDANRNPVPSSFLTGTHGAKAAYTLLAQSGYQIQRWDSPLSQLADHAGPDTVVLFAEPYAAETEDQRAVAEILHKGGRVLATGPTGALLLPRSHTGSPTLPSFAACEAQPEGLSPLVASGSIWIVPRVIWTATTPEIRTVYACAGEPVVVEYPVSAPPSPSKANPAQPNPTQPKPVSSNPAQPNQAPSNQAQENQGQGMQGRAIWWASSTPLENGSIQRGANLDLLLNSIGPAQTPNGPIHLYWDESLHGDSHSSWEYVRGPLWPLLWSGSALLLLLVLFSFSRRSGPIRPLPRAPRTTPIEFLEALGALYRSTGAASTALQVAWERFRAQSALLTGQRTAQMDAKQIAFALERRFGSAAAGIEPDLIAAEEACYEDHLKPRRALILIRTLRQHEETLRQASRH
jgi:hypothetical protein